MKAKEIFAAILLVALGAYIPKHAQAQNNNSYSVVLKNTTNQRLNLNSKVKMDSNIYKKCSSLLFTTLVDSVFPAWYGTPWDFDGISNTPGTGEIACGYFVSTTLKHVGFNLNRYKLAQQASSIIVKEVCGTSKNYSDIDKLIGALECHEGSLFIVGLDFHVGFLVVQNSEVYFVHSDYTCDAVRREKASESEGLNSSFLFVVGEITDNSDLMNSWLVQEKIY